VRRAAQIMAPFFVLPWLAIPVLARLPDPQHASARLLTGNTTLLTLLGLLLAFWGGYAAYLLLRNPDDLARTENHPAWTHMYLILMAAQVGFALAYVF
jgi:ABC-type branched-subunit amino acid transport system permease subunit